MRLKPVQEQVVVILGASSGIGRETALRFAGRGAKVVVAARGEAGLASLVEEIRAGGGEATYVTCDVTDPAQVEAVAAAAVGAFGRIDTWVNVAAVSIYARFEETTPEEFRRIMDVNFMGQVHGAQAAIPRLRRAGGGALIAISSVESRVGMPLHSAYSASKHAVEGVLDALRRELMEEGAPISVTSVKPTTIDTPLFDNSRTKLGVRPKGPPPVYDPGVVADCVLYAAEHPVRELFGGGAARMMSLSQTLAPRLMDAVVSRIAGPAQRSDVPKTSTDPDNFDAPREEEQRVRGSLRESPRRFSLYTWMETHPRTVLAGSVVAATALLVARSGRRAASFRRDDAELGRAIEREPVGGRSAPAAPFVTVGTSNVLESGWREDSSLRDDAE